MIKFTSLTAHLYIITCCALSLACSYGEQNSESSNIATEQARFGEQEPPSNEDLGIRLARARQYQEAIIHLQDSLQLDRKPNPILHGMLGICFLNTGELIAAERHFREAVSADPDAMDWQVALAQVLMERGKYREAKDILEELKRRELQAEK